MSRHAIDDRLDLVRADVDRGLRLAALLLVPAAMTFVVLGREVTVLLFAHGVTTPGQAGRVGLVLSVFAVGLLPFSVYQLQSRAFYAMRDTRTPALVQVAVAGVLVTVDVALSLLLPDDVRVYGLAAGHAAAYSTGVAISVWLLRRRLGPRGSEAGRAPVARTLVRLLAAGVLGGAVAAGVAVLVGPAVPDDWRGAGVVLLAAGAAGVVVYAGATLLLGVAEARAGAAAVRRRLHR